MREVLAKLPRARTSITGWFRGPIENISPNKINHIRLYEMMPCLPPAISPTTIYNTEIIKKYLRKCDDNTIKYLSYNNISSTIDVNKYNDEVSQTTIESITNNILENISKDSIQKAIDTWINPNIFTSTKLRKIRHTLYRESYVEINKFLKVDKYKAILQALNEQELNSFNYTNNDKIFQLPKEKSFFEIAGPINTRFYYRGIDNLIFNQNDDHTDILQEFGRFLYSPEFFAILRQLTECKVVGMYLVVFML